ncbi:DUF1543 domain-containing protein [Myroides pelagicus]|uniref:DUF1543 domain-containing protein n=1 Tax=Myroides pelagicus TaxID=270914 RepID=A0A7K1GPN4_9FLAO|nr:DUF1543 domain-containing protein [Myroides pelagicus]MTH30865.1 DUF1543 domain-containing protein [Myroides pelagicus]
MSKKLFMTMLGATPPGRHIEQHDIYFGIATDMKELATRLNDFWPEAGKKLHVDAWREVNTVEDYHIEVVDATEAETNDLRLFFLNLGGYKPGVFDEFHHLCLVVANSSAEAIKKVKTYSFYQDYNLPPKGLTHIDNKYGIDVDEIYAIEEILDPKQKQDYSIRITPAKEDAKEDEITLGYMKLSSFEK